MSDRSCPLKIVLGSWLCCAWLAGPCAADVVHVAASDGRGKTHGVEGKVLDYTGRELTLLTTSGRKRVIPTERVGHVQTEWNEQHQAGNLAWKQADWQKAITYYRAANQSEQRTWVRRQILTRLMRSYQATGDLTAAGKLFLLIAASDPDTPAYQSMPLAWSSSGGVDPQQAEHWLEQTDVLPAILLGASHLVSGPTHSQAVRTLQELRQMADASGPLATLATAQIWRAQMLEAPEDDVQVWMRQVETFPEPLRAGPYFVLGVACQRLQQLEQASLYYLRVPILYPDRQRLAARALLAAARLQQQNDRSAAITLLKEVTSRYKGTTEQEIAQRILATWEE